MGIDLRQIQEIAANLETICAMVDEILDDRYTFADAKEFAHAIVARFPNLKNTTELVQKIYEEHKGKDKETMLKVYRENAGAPAL
ncbi:hypothetical protein [Burkholderia cepacia]|uniref:hypothetical protein n=1 Tax=Burkholderia cepacia TaxID=292 RepID=UPI002AB6F3EF|nr:hypothetical protein [Burkholderia cepacia]